MPDRPPAWLGLLERWNFIARARLERQLWEAFERGEDLEALVDDCRRRVAGAEPGASSFQLEVWQTTLQRIRRIEAVMGQKPNPRQAGDRIQESDSERS